MPISNAARGFAAILATLFASAAAAQQCPERGQYKALELYSWKVDDRWQIAILPATERAKTEKEIKSSPCRSEVCEPLAFTGAALAEQDVYWFHRGLRGFSYPPPGAVSAIRQQAATRGLRLHGPPAKDPRPLTAAQCRRQEAALAATRREAETELAAERSDMVNVMEGVDALNAARPRAAASTSTEARRAFSDWNKASRERWDAMVARNKVFNDAIVEWNREADALAAACSHRTSLEGDLRPLEGPQALYAGGLTAEEDAALTKQALAGEVPLHLWLHPDSKRRPDSVSVAGDLIVAGAGMSAALRVRHRAVLERATSRQGVVAAVPEGGSGSVQGFYSIEPMAQGFLLEVSILVFDTAAFESAQNEDRAKEAITWRATLRSLLPEGADPFPVYESLAKRAFGRFLQPAP